MLHSEKVTGTTILINFENEIKMAPFLYIAYFVFGTTSQALLFTEFEHMLHRTDAAADRCLHKHSAAIFLTN